MKKLCLDPKVTLVIDIEGAIYFEKWREVKGFEGIYNVSSFGRVKSLKFRKEKILKNGESSVGYCMVVLSKSCITFARTVHQLVAESFLGHAPCGFKLVINHIDFNKLNNFYLNFKIVTNRENSNKKHIKSSSQYTGVSWNKINQKWVSHIFINRRLKHLGYFDNEYHAHLAYQKALADIDFLENFEVLPYECEPVENHLKLIYKY